MKPLHIALLVAAGALGGAVVMKVTERSAQSPIAANTPAAVTAPAAESAQTVAVTAPAPSPAPLPAAEPVSAPPVAQPKQSAVRVARPPVKHVSPRKPQLAVVRPPQATVPVIVPPPSAPAAAPDPEPLAPAVIPSPLPPARPEPENVTPLPPPPPEPQKVTLNAGTLIPVRLVDGLSTERNMPGDPFNATLDKELVADGFVIAERGARVEGRVVSSERGGRVSGVAALAVELKRLKLSDGQWVTLGTDSFERHADPSHRDDAVKVGAGAALGAMIGAIAGGGKGAAIGAGAGGAAGAGTVMATRGKAATLTSETRINFRLNIPVTITEKR